MAKKIKSANHEAQEMTIITAAAERVMEAKRQIKELETEMKKDIEIVREHAKRTGCRRYGNVEVYERSNPVKLILPESMTQDELKNLLSKNKFDRYLRTDVDVKLMIKNWGADDGLMKLLAKNKIHAEQDVELHLKHF